MKEENREIEKDVAVLIAELGPGADSCPQMPKLRELQEALERVEAFVKSL